MNILKSWRESFSFFKPSFFKESFGLLKGFLPFFLKYFSWAAILYVVFSYIDYNALFFAKGFKFDGAYSIIKYVMLYGKLIMNYLLDFSLIVFIFLKYLNGKARHRFLNYLLIFIAWALSVYFIGKGIGYFSRLLYGFIYGPISTCNDQITKASWLFDSIRFVSWFDYLLLLFPITVFFAFELLWLQGSVKNIFRPFFSYPFFITFLTITWAIKYFILGDIEYLVKGSLGLFVIYIIAVIFLNFFYIAIIANVYIKQSKKDESFLKAGFFRFFSK